jgi:hypothetical protein
MRYLIPFPFCKKRRGRIEDTYNAPKPVLVPQDLVSRGTIKKERRGGRNRKIV